MAHLISEIPEYEHVSIGLQAMVADVWQIPIVNENDIDPLRDDKLKGQTIHIRLSDGGPDQSGSPCFWHKCFYFVIPDMIS